MAIVAIFSLGDRCLSNDRRIEEILAHAHDDFTREKRCRLLCQLPDIDLMTSECNLLFFCRYHGVDKNNLVKGAIQGFAQEFSHYHTV